MSIKAVFRVQCSGPCGGWLSQTGEVIRLNPPSRDVGLYPGGRAAAKAARDAGWAVDRNHHAYCPECTVNPLGIKLPPPSLVCVCTHSVDYHYGPADQCQAIPGVLGCECLGFMRAGVGLPKPCPDCGHVHRGRACGEFHCLCRTVNA